jgi:hypothetical protein
MTSRHHRRLLARLEAQLLAGTDSPEEALRQAFSLLPDDDLDRIAEALDRIPDDGSNRVPAELLTSEEAASLRRLYDLVALRQQP